MPLLPTPDTETLQDHFFGAGNWGEYSWFSTSNKEDHFPATVTYHDAGDPEANQTIEITEEMFVDGIKQFAEILPDRTFQDLIEDMDAADVDAVIQLIFWGEIRIS